MQAIEIFRTNGTFTPQGGVFDVTVESVRFPRLAMSNTGGQLGMAIGGSNTSGFLDTYGNAWMMGNNTGGSQGNGTVMVNSSPIAVLGALTFSQFSVYGNWAATLTPQGKAFSWGRNDDGQLGVGDVTMRSSPVAVLGGLIFQSLVLGPPASNNASFGSVFGLTENGIAYSWGNNLAGQLGVGDVLPRSSPVAVLGGLRFATILTLAVTGGVSTVGLTAAGAAYSWGSNVSGQLGVGDVTARSSPVAVLGGHVFTKVVATPTQGSGPAVLALDSAGAAWAWGGNTSGQLGTGDATPRSSPVAVLGGIVFSDIFAVGTSFFGVRASDGALFGWGSNTGGVLGVGDITGRSSPAAVLGSLTFKNILSLGASSVVGITADGAAYSWGLNTNSLLGVGDATNRSSPVAVSGGLTWAYITAFTSNGVVGIDTSGDTYSWGVNDSGQLGLGDVTTRNTPSLILGGHRMQALAVVQTQTVKVTPGTAYPITVNNLFCKFGGVVVGSQPADYVRVTYDQ